jgi:UDP-N-acetylglucosamine 2-epimerase
VIALFFGTRPQVIKASVLRHALSRVGKVVAIDTGQHYDYALHQVHYEQLGVAAPDVFLQVGSSTHARQTAAMLVAAEEWIGAHQPDLAVVIGDTNSTLACALAAAKSRIPVAHVEAGLRAKDFLMAEEINRRCVDAIASVLLAPCARAAATLEEEQSGGEIHVVGDVALDVLRGALPRVSAVETVDGYDPAWGSDFLYVTLHRAELVDDAEKLRDVVAALQDMPLPVLFAAHPRTAAALQRAEVRLNPRVRMRAPLGYLESLSVLRDAAAVVTDSGGIQREAYWLGVPCVTVRAESEWSETVGLGANRLVPPEGADELPGAVTAAIKQSRSWDRSAYGDGTAAERVAAILAGR